MAKKKRRGRSAAFMRSINPNLRNRKVFKSRSRRSSMAKRRKSRSRSRSSGMTGIWATVLGVGGYIVFDAIIKPYIPLSGTVLSLGEIVLGLYLSKKSGVVGSVGKVMVILNVFALLKSYISPLVSGVIGVPTY